MNESNCQLRSRLKIHLYVAGNQLAYILSLHFGKKNKFTFLFLKGVDIFN